MYFYRICALLLFVGLSFTRESYTTSPQLQDEARSTNLHAFSVPRHRRGNYRRDGAAAKARIFRRMGWQLPPGHATKLNSLYTGPSTGHIAPTQQSGTAAGRSMEPTSSTRSAAPTATGSLPSTPESDHSEYMSQIRVGNQQLQIDFDTGSSDFWLFSTLLPPSQRAGHQEIYDPHSSPTFVNRSSLHWSITYGDASAAQGVVGSDTVHLGAIPVSDQSIELATAVTKGFTADVPIDGLVGMAFSNINNVRPTRQRTLFDNLRPLLRAPLFAADLAEDGSGAYHFGYVDPSLIPPAGLTTVPINPANGFWQFPSPAFALAGNTTRRPRASPAIADSGTSLLLVDPDVADTYWRAVPGAAFDYYYGGYVFPCNVALPSLGVAVGDVDKGTGTLITIPGRVLDYARVDHAVCYGGLQSNEGEGLQIFGDILFRSALVVFRGDVGAPTLGVAQKKVV